MALVKKQNSRRTIILITALLLVVAGGLIAIYIIQNPGSVSTNVVTRRDLRIITDFGVDTLRSAAVQSLRPYGALPINPEPDAGGSPDPFHTTE